MKKKEIVVVEKPVSAFAAMIAEKAAKITLSHATCRKKASEAFKDMRAYSKAGHDKAMADAKTLGFTLENRKDAQWEKLKEDRVASMLKALRKAK